MSRYSAQSGIFLSENIFVISSETKEPVVSFGTGLKYFSKVELPGKWAAEV